MANIRGTDWRTTRKLLVRQCPGTNENGEHLARRWLSCLMFRHKVDVVLMSFVGRCYVNVSVRPKADINRLPVNDHLNVHGLWGIALELPPGRVIALTVDEIAGLPVNP